MLQLDCIFTDSLFWDLFGESDSAVWYQASASLHYPFNHEASTELQLNFYHAPPPLVCHSPRLQLLPMTSSCLQNQYHPGTVTQDQVWLLARGIALAPCGS